MQSSLTSQLADVRKSLTSWQRDLTQQEGARSALLRVRNKEQTAYDATRNEAALSAKAHLFLLAEITERRQKAVEAIEDMGSSALKLVYGEGYRLKFQSYDEKKTSAGASGFRMEILIGSPYEGGELLTQLLGERGGGVLEVVAFALRIAALNWVGYKGPLLLDEAYKSISSDGKVDAVANFLRHVCDQMGRQLIFATHKLDVFGPLSDHIVHVTKEDGIAKIKTLSPGAIVPGNITGSGLIKEDS
jgi:hypothetical protein